MPTKLLIKHTNFVALRCFNVSMIYLLLNSKKQGIQQYEHDTKLLVQASIEQPSCPHFNVRFPRITRLHLPPIKTNICFSFWLNIICNFNSSFC